MSKLSHRLAQPDWWTAIFSGIVAMTAICALWYAHSQIKEAHDEAQIQHLMTLVNEYDQEPMATYRRGLADERLNTSDDDPPELYRILDFYETVGRLIDRGYLNETDVWNEFGYWVLHLNADNLLMARVSEEQRQNPNEYAVYLQLVDRMQRIDQAHGSHLLKLDQTDLTNFYNEELRIVGGMPARGNLIYQEK